MPDLSCPICTKGKFARKFLEACDLVTKEVFTLLECDYCGVKKTDPFPEDISRYYQTDVGTFMKSGQSNIHSFFKNILLRRELTRITKKIKAQEFLDVGCGTGDFVKIIHDKQYKVCAVDSVPNRPVCIANEEVPYYVIDYANYEIKDFLGMNNGIVILRHALEHFKDPEAFMNKMLGYDAKAFYIVLPNISSIKAKIFAAYNWSLDPPRHLWHFDKKSLRILLEKLNLEVVDSGFDTIPTIVPSVYRFMRIKNFPQAVYKHFKPKGTLAALSLPFDYLLPNDVLWFIAKVR